MQIEHGSGARLLRANRSLQGVSLTSTSAVFKTVGYYDTQAGLSFIDGMTIYFCGGTTVVPDDQEAVIPQSTTEDFPVGILVLIVAIIVLCFACIFSLYYYRMQKKVRGLTADLTKMKDQMVGVEAVVQDYDPRTAVSGDGSADLRPITPIVPQAGPQAFRTVWYWQEDDSRLSAHNQNEIFQPGNFVKYAGSVCAELEDAYMEWMDGRGPAKRNVDLQDRISSTGTESKAFAPDSGTVFEMDFNQMQQINRKSRFARTILRREVAIPAAGDSSANPPRATGGSKRTRSKDRAGDASLPPADLADEDFLVLHIGQLVQFSKKRPDGWAFGVVIFDEVEDRPSIDQQGVTTSSGWFPASCTDTPSNAQLKKLQAIMGGEGAANALNAPDSWDPVKDPLVAQLFRVPDGAEKQAAVNAFMATLPNTVKIISVDRIQNMSLWQSYAVKRQTVTATSDTPAQVERAWLFHGTTEDIVPKIMQQGFNRSFCGRNATMYGKGVYFARDSSYSSSKIYSAPDGKGIQRMFLCRVTVGAYCQGRKDGLSPDVKSGHILYDTTVDNMRDPSIFVTYHDGQGYPEYLIHFTQP
jgi:poly [ADP-ribose] polymerase 10/14/15